MHCGSAASPDIDDYTSPAPILKSILISKSHKNSTGGDE